MKSRNHLGHRISIHRAERIRIVEINPSPNIRCWPRIQNRIRFRCCSRPQSSCQMKIGERMSEWKSEIGSRKPCALSRHGNKKAAEKRFNLVVCDLQKNPKSSTKFLPKKFHINFSPSRFCPAFDAHLFISFHRCVSIPCNCKLIDYLPGRSTTPPFSIQT